MRRAIGGVLLLLGLLSGCAGPDGKAPAVRHYVLEYPPPVALGRPAVDALLRVERFQADRAVMGQAMLYRRGAFQREAYASRRWRIAPVDMTTGLIRRDLRAASLFRAVLSEREAQEARFSLTGVLEEFHELVENGTRRAAVQATVTLLDHRRRETDGLVVFQKTCRAEAAVTGDGGAGLAAAMSAAVADLSRQVIAEAAGALKAPGRI